MNSFRKIAASIVLALVLGIILVAFVLGDIAGVGGALQAAGRDPVVARVGGWRLGPLEFGGTVIKGREVRDQFNRDLERFGGQITADQAVRMGVPSRTLRTIEQRLLLDRAIQDHGVVVSDQQVRQAITDTRAFAGVDGKFSRDVFMNALRQTGTTEARFVADMRRQIALEQLLGATAAGARAPAVVRDAMFRFRNEKRIAEVVSIDAAKITDVPEPTDAQLKTLYDANPRRFELPERRSLSFVVMSADDFTAQVGVSEDELKRVFEDRKNEFGRPEKRDVDQVLVDDEATARKIADAVAGGKSLDDAAKEIAGKAVIKLGVVEKRELPPEIAEAVFASDKPGAAIAPVKTPFGWHVPRVNRIDAGEAPDFAAARAKLEAEFRAQAAPDLLDKQARAFEKALGRLDKLEDAAQTVNATIRTVADVDAAGAGPDGMARLAGPWTQDMLQAAFRLKEGETGALGETKAGVFYVVRADKVAPARTPPFDEVKDKVKTAWTLAERRRLAVARAKEIADRVGAVAELASLAAAAKLEVKTAKPITRAENDGPAGLTDALVGALFQLTPGKTASVATDSGAAVVRLKEIVAADPATAAADLEKLGKDLDSAMSNDLAAQYVASLERRYGITRDTAAFAALFRPEQQ
ncbi:MAG: peptidyl-prolyl cis-trans isomerase [Rhodospirillales bacterium]|nr:MAG: peptidyl-prolyl cis-trans isomerase [Rhodospirillales bacterium]